MKGIISYLKDIRNFIDLLPPLIMIGSEIFGAIDRYKHYDAIYECLN